MSGRPSVVLAAMVAVLVLGGCRLGSSSQDSDDPTSAPRVSDISSPLETTATTQADNTSPLDARLKRRIADCVEDRVCEALALDTFVVDCLDVAGFQSVLLPGGVYRTDPGGREKELIEAMKDCDQRAFAAVPPGPEPTPEYFSNYYGFLLELKECVKGEGYSVADPPSKEAFVESKGAVWHPFENMDHLTVEFKALEESCPPHFAG